MWASHKPRAMSFGVSIDPAERVSRDGVANGWPRGRASLDSPPMRMPSLHVQPARWGSARSWSPRRAPRLRRPHRRRCRRRVPRSPARPRPRHRPRPHRQRRRRRPQRPCAFLLVRPERAPLAICRCLRRRHCGRSAWWNDRVFYEVFVRSFKDSDGDGIGDLKGLIASWTTSTTGTSHDRGPGRDGLWLMPVSESPSYHGYDVTDYEAIEQDYGTIDGLQAADGGGAQAGHRGHRRHGLQPHRRDQHPGSRTR